MPPRKPEMPPVEHSVGTPESEQAPKTLTDVFNIFIANHQSEDTIGLDLEFLQKSLAQKLSVERIMMGNWVEIKSDDVEVSNVNTDSLPFTFTAKIPKGKRSVTRQINLTLQEITRSGKKVKQPAWRIY